MAIGTVSNFKVYNDYIQGNFAEMFMQNTEAFNAASQGTIVLSTEEIQGDYQYESFFEQTAAVGRRVLTDVNAITDNAVTQDDLISVKLSRTHHQATTRSQWAMIGADPALFGRIYAQQLDQAIRLEMLDRGLAACHAAISNVAALEYDASDGTINTADLVSGLALFGDKATDIVCWVMHSKPYFDLVNNQISANITGVSNLNVATASPVTLNRPVLITDSTSLTISATGTRYITLGLTRGAIRCIMSQSPYTATEEVTGLGNLVIRNQTEYAYNLGLRGFKWDTSNGGTNPTDGNVATASNWDQAATSNKSLPGLWIRSQ